MSKFDLQGHTLSVTLDSWADVLAHLSQQSLPQVTIVEEDGKYVLSRPLPKEERAAFAHLYRRQGRSPNGPDKPKPPTGPRGGGPSGTPGAGRQTEYTRTEAKAA